MRRRDFVKAGGGLVAGTALGLGRVAAVNPWMAKEGEAMASVAEVQAGFEARRERMLLATAGGQNLTEETILDEQGDIYAALSLANMALGRHVAACNAHMRYGTTWYDHPHPHGRHHKGEVDFLATRLARAYATFREDARLEASTKDAIVQFFTEKDFKSHHGSENHVLLFRACRYAMAKELPGHTFAEYGATGLELMREDASWLSDFIKYRAQYAWGEFDSTGYMRVDLEGMSLVFDFSGEGSTMPDAATGEDRALDSRLHEMSGMMMNVLLADMSVDSLGWMYCGAHGRIYQRQALDHASDPSNGVQQLYFGNVPEAVFGDGGTAVDLLLCGFRPDDAVVDLALNRRRSYVNRERKHLHNTKDVRPERPVPGSIRKYTWYHPDYVLGAIALQDRYPDDHEGRWYAHHEQHEWDLTIGTNPRARIFTHHPGDDGNEHGIWTGDLRCGCGHFFQHRTAVLAIYDIPKDQPFPWIHAYVPRDAFDEVVEQADWIFVRGGQVYVALRMMGGHRWTGDGEWAGVEVVSDGSRNAALCEAGHADDFGSFEAFREEVALNGIKWNPEDLALSYASKRAGTLYADASGLRQVDGAQADMDWKTYDCPYLEADWGSGVIQLRSPWGSERTYDFT